MADNSLHAVNRGAHISEKVSFLYFLNPVLGCRQQCGYTELDRGETSMLGNIFDFLVGG